MPNLRGTTISGRRFSLVNRYTPFGDRALFGLDPLAEDETTPEEQRSAPKARNLRKGRGAHRRPLHPR